MITYKTLFKGFLVYAAGVASANATMYLTNAAGALYTVDTSNATVTLVGNLPPSGGGVGGCCDGYNEIAYDETTGTAWAQERNGNFRAQAFNVSDASGIGGAVENGASMHGWEFVDGTLYVAGFAGSLANGLGTIDPNVGVASLVTIRDDWSSDTNDDVITGLACSANVLYGITNGDDSGESSLYSIATDGSLTLIGPTGMRAGSLEFGNDGVLYAGGVSSQAGLLYSIDPTTGSSTLIGDTGVSSGGGISGLMRTGSAPSACNSIDGVVTPAAPATPVPALPLWALWFLAGITGLIGSKKLRKST